MSDYKKLVQSEAKSFFGEQHPVYLEDGGEFGGKSDSANFLKWLDRTKKLNEIVEKTVGSWGAKEFHWVRTNTRNPAPAGGDPRSNAFGSFYSDVLHELKRLNKKATGA